MLTVREWFVALQAGHVRWVEAQRQWPKTCLVCGVLLTPANTQPARCATVNISAGGMIPRITSLAAATKSIGSLTGVVDIIADIDVCWYHVSASHHW